MAPTKRYKASSKSSSSMAGSAPSLQLVTMLNADDVLLGRGAQIMNFMGNVRFRDMVNARRGVYMGTGRHNTKQEVAQQIFDEVHRRGGRFLRRLEPNEAAQLLGMPHERNVWVIASEDVAMEKVKQALRDKETVRTGDQGPTGGAASGDAAVQESTTSNDVVLNSPPASDNLVQGVAAPNLPWMSQVGSTALTPQALPSTQPGLGAPTLIGLARDQQPQMLVQLGQNQLAQQLQQQQPLLQQPHHPLAMLHAQAAQSLYSNMSPPPFVYPVGLSMQHGLHSSSTASISNFFNSVALQAAQRAQHEQFVQQSLIASLQQQRQRQQQQEDERRQLLMQQQILFSASPMSQPIVPGMPRLDFAHMTGGLSGLSTTPLNGNIVQGTGSIPAALAPTPTMALRGTILGQGATPPPATSAAVLPSLDAQRPLASEAIRPAHNTSAALTAAPESSGDEDRKPKARRNADDSSSSSSSVPTSSLSSNGEESAEKKDRPERKKTKTRGP